ncbi:hypothetical protein JMJ56_24515 [Belnapia sp. T18]|uniref:Uncharacterized protein n=1 Tax=Belnapia arida TaxID=2804533 RepID=A0ABS1U910_9PROT|nr:hypothetical protein [Belnapia arida]MBL6081168.1 hypothetical protein [Belnapia arida]
MLEEFVRLWQGASLPYDVAATIEDEVEAQLAPGELEASGGIEILGGLAEQLLAAVTGIKRDDHSAPPWPRPRAGI